MSDPKQPKFVPVVAGDLDDGAVYSHPGQPWDGEASLDLPPAGTYSTGAEPASSWVSAQSFNRLLRDYGRHIEAIADAPTFDLHAAGGDHGVGGTTYTKSTDTTQFNVNGVSDPPLLIAATVPATYEDASPTNTFKINGLLARTDNAWANDAGFSRFRSFTSGKAIWGADTAEYVPWDPNDNLAPAHIPEAEAGQGLVFGSDGGSNMLALGSGRATMVSTNGGHDFADATALPTNANWHYPLVACAVGSQWVVIDQIDTTTTVNRLVVSGDLTAASWTVKGSSIGGPNSSDIRRITYNASIAVFLPSANTNFGYWRPGDANVTAFRLGGIANDSTRTGWRGAWNEQIGLFMIGNLQGDLWTSTDGINWAQIANNAAGLAVTDLLAHGRGFVVANGVGPAPAAAVDFIDFDRKQAWRRRNILKARMPIVASGFHLARSEGRWYAGRVTKYSISGPAFGAGLELYYSGVNQWDLNNAVGR